MKIRSQFVSNSSSTSFVVKYDILDFKECECCHHKSLTPLKLAELEEGKSSSGEETCINFTGRDDYIKQIQENIEYESQSSFRCVEYVESLQKELIYAKNLPVTKTEEILGVTASNGGYLKEELERLIEEGIVQEMHYEVNN